MHSSSLLIFGTLLVCQIYFAQARVAPVYVRVQRDVSHLPVVQAKSAYEHQHYDVPAVKYAEPHVAIPILSYVNDISFDGAYKYGYSTANGIQVQEEGSLKQYGKELEPAQYVVGSYQYTSPEGLPISVTYTADESGFHSKTSYAGQPQAKYQA